MTLAIEGLTGTSGFRNYASIWYLDENSLPADGANNCVVTFSGTSSTPETQLYVAEYGGIGQGAPASGDTDSTVQTTGATIVNSPLGAITARRWAFSCMQSGNTGGGFTHGQSQTQIWGFNDASTYTAVAELRGSTGITSIDSTYSGTVNRLVRVAAVWDAWPSGMYVNIGSVWKRIDNPYVYESAWNTVVAGWIYKSGAWKRLP
jgi:hypothetical protein